MGMLEQVLGGVIASRMGGRGGMGGFGAGRGRGGMVGGGLGGGLGKAMLVMLAAKAAQEYMQRRNTAPSTGSTARGPGGGLSGMLAGAGGAGGLGALIEQFRRNGHGDDIDSWVKPGPNRRLAPDELADALGQDTVDDLAQEAGMPKKQLLEELSETLPDAVDQLTPDGRLPPANAL